VDGEAFARAVEAVRLGATTQAEAKNLYDQLSDAERLGLLDGDDEIWPHLRELIAEGYKVCEAIHHGGMTDMQAIDMVENDLAVSSSAAIDVYTAATIGLGC
jgi:hypothetical protein